MDADPKTLELAQDAPRRSMQRLVREFLDARCMDNMELMAEFPDGHFDLAIVDPPYGLGKKLLGGFNREEGKSSLDTYKGKAWDVVPPPEYFAELRRVSKHQIIWGGNYFDLPPCRGFVVWDKNQPMPSMSFGEFAWTSFDKPARKVEYAYTNYVEGRARPNPRIHPTQKPVGLYDWLLANYAKQGDRILDTHMGSGSIAIACHYARLHLTACEVDPDYFTAACTRIERETAQDSFCFPNDELRHEHPKNHD